MATEALKALRLRREIFEELVPDGDLFVQERKNCNLLDFSVLSQEEIYQTDI